MSIIEQAAKRLEELKNAGVDVPDAGSPSAPGGGTADARPSRAVEPAPAPRAFSPKRLDIDLAKLRAAGMLLPDSPETKLAHEFRVIKWPLIQNARGKSAAPITRANLIMITSSVPGEGKSFIATNLAMSIAMEVNNTVLLVDADASANSVPRILGVSSPGPGLLDLVSDPHLDVESHVLATNVERLSILLGGKRRPHSAELLASENMRRVFGELARNRDRIVVVDAPPLLAAAEARVLASFMGQIVVVVEAERTTQSALNGALSTIEGCPVIMTVLNKTDKSEVGSYYGYHSAEPG